MCKSNNSTIFEPLFEALPFGVYIVDMQTCRLLFANRQMAAIAGKSIQTDKLCYREVFNSDAPCMHCRIKQLQGSDVCSGENLIHEYFNETNDKWYQMQELVIPWLDGRMVKCTFAVDISELKAAQNSLAEAHARLAIKTGELEHIYVRDVLTGAYNRNKLNEIMEIELGRYERYGRLFSIIIMDIDSFKELNDSLGHLAGDSVLYEMAKLIMADTRTTDMLCRWGGEEFLLVCPETDSSCIKSLAENLRRLVAGHDFDCGRRVTVSLGMTTVKSGDTQDKMISRADEAMYESKAKGKNACTSK